MNDYVVATFVVVWFVLLLYVAVVAMRTAKMAREVELLARVIERERDSSSQQAGHTSSAR